MLLQVPDALASQFADAAALAKVPLQVHLERIAAEALTTVRKQTAPPAFTVSEDDVQWISGRLGLGAPIRTAFALRELIDRFGGLSIADLRIPLPPATLTLLEERARREEVTAESYVRRIVAQIAAGMNLEGFLTGEVTTRAVARERANPVPPVGGGRASA